MNNFFEIGASDLQLRYYYIAVLISLFYFIIKFKQNKFQLFIILIFFSGLFSYYGKNVQNIYRIILVIYMIIILFRSNVFKIIGKKDILLFFSFLLFTSSFLYSAALNNDYFFITFSQYSRYFILFALFIYLKKYRDDQFLKFNLEMVIQKLLILQIILGFVKFIIMGPIESVVGSIAFIGGSPATPIAILGFMYIWISHKGELKRNEWIFIIGLLFISFVSQKRAIWFVMPIILALMMYYVPKRKMTTNIKIISFLIIPTIFYLGVRLNYTLNKEHKVWGSFDLNYAFDYANKYSFGNNQEEQKGVGRGGATLLLFDKLNAGNLNRNDWLGYGLRYVYTTNYEEFNQLGLGINSKGSATGVFQTLVANGYLGVVSTLLFVFSMLVYTKNNRLRLVLFLFFIWEYFFYLGIVIRDQALSFILIYIVLFAPKIFTKIEQNKNFEIVKN